MFAGHAEFKAEIDPQDNSTGRGSRAASLFDDEIQTHQTKNSIKLTN